MLTPPILRRRSTRISYAPSRLLNTPEMSLRPRKRPRNRVSSAPDDSPTSHPHPLGPNATGCTLLKLSSELLQQIALYLHPRDAIFFSLSSRYLYFGPLSASNSLLWYTVGNFHAYFPGYSKIWVENAKWYFMYELPEEEKAHLVIQWHRNRVDPNDVIEKMKLGRKRRFGRRKYEVPESYDHVDPSEKVREYFPGETPMGVGYKEMLVQTMLGDTEKGCQWCLKEPLTQKWSEGWGMRVCYGCFHGNVVSVSSLRKIKHIDISHLGIATRNYRNGGGHCSGVFRPAIERLIRASYGPQATLASVLKDIQDEKKRAREERHRSREGYRQTQRKLIFEYIKVLWERLGKGIKKLDYGPGIPMEEFYTFQVDWSDELTTSAGSTVATDDEEEASSDTHTDMENTNYQHEQPGTKKTKESDNTWIPKSWDMFTWVVRCIQIIECQLPSSNLKFEWFFPAQSGSNTDTEADSCFTSPDIFDPTLYQKPRPTPRARGNYYIYQLLSTARDSVEVVHPTPLSANLRMNLRLTKNDQDPKWLSLAAWNLIEWTISRLYEYVTSLYSDRLQDLHEFTQRAHHQARNTHMVPSGNKIKQEMWDAIVSAFRGKLAERLGSFCEGSSIKDMANVTHDDWGFCFYRWYMVVTKGIDLERLVVVRSVNPAEQGWMDDNCMQWTNRCREWGDRIENIRPEFRHVLKRELVALGTRGIAFQGAEEREGPYYSTVA